MQCKETKVTRFRTSAISLLVVLLNAGAAAAQTVQDRLKAVEAELQRLQQEVETLRREAEAQRPLQTSPPSELTTKDTIQPFAEQIPVPDLGSDERDHKLEAKPEVFLQTRFSRNPLPGTKPGAEVNFQLTRIEVRWAGRISPRVGAGIEMQFQPALEGSPDEIVNDAFLEFYPRDGITLRAGQFVKPFGFDVQQSSSEREYPERAMFEGYFFPGERDRGVMFRWDTGSERKAVVKNTVLSAAILNGNRFFNDVDYHLNTLFRVRRLLPNIGLAIGGSAEFGSQLLPSGVVGDSNVRILGVDAQYAIRRFGARFEIVRGTRPSTLLSREPEFASSFAPGTHTSGGAASGLFRLTPTDQIYVRYDTLFGDPETGKNVRATSAGYLRFLGEHTRFGLNYQWKNHPTFNDDSVNTRFQTTLGIVF
jgi:hypothetical protein